MILFVELFSGLPPCVTDPDTVTSIGAGSTPVIRFSLMYRPRGSAYRGQGDNPKIGWNDEI